MSLRLHTVTGENTIRHDPGTDHIQAEGGKIDHPAAVGDVPDGNGNPLPLQTPQDLIKALPLETVIRVMPHLADGQVGEYPLKLHVGEGTYFLHHGDGILSDGPASPHPGIDLDMHGEMRPILDQLFAQRLREVDIRYRGDKVILDDLIDLRCRGRTQDDNRCVDPADPELHPLIRIGYPEAIHAVFHGGP